MKSRGETADPCQTHPYKHTSTQLTPAAIVDSVYLFPCMRAKENTLDRFLRNTQQLHEVSSSAIGSFQSRNVIMVMSLTCLHVRQGKAMPCSAVRQELLHRATICFTMRVKKQLKNTRGNRLGSPNLGKTCRMSSCNIHSPKHIRKD